MEILIVDDSSTVRSVVKSGLLNRLPSVTIDEARDGEEAKRKLESNYYDFIICDWEMPRMTGDELLKWVRSHPALGTIPFIMLTSLTDKANVMKAIQLGTNGYIVKPFTIDVLVQKINAITNKFESREHERITASSPISLRFRSNQAHGSLIDISLGGLFSTFSKKNHLPQILEKSMIDLDNDAGQPQVSGIEGFSIRIQAAEAFLDTENIKIAIKFLDMSTEKKEMLGAFLMSLKTGVSD